MIFMCATKTDNQRGSQIAVVRGASYVRSLNRKPRCVSEVRRSSAQIGRYECSHDGACAGDARVASAEDRSTAILTSIRPQFDGSNRNCMSTVDTSNLSIQNLFVSIIRVLQPGGNILLVQRPLSVYDSVHLR